MLNEGVEAFSALRAAAEQIQKNIAAQNPPITPITEAPADKYNQNFIDFMSVAMQTLTPDKQQQLINKTMEFYVNLSKN